MKGVSEVRQANGYDVDAARVRLRCEDESLAIQSQKEEADINVLVKRFGVTGMMPVRQMPEPLVGHFETFDMMSAQALMLEARASFMSLDAETRKRFGNDPVDFVRFAGNPDNLDEMVKLGLAVKKPEAAPEKIQKVQIVEVEGGEEGGAGGSGRGRGASERGSARRSDPPADR